jgi:hypothetical protein
MNSRTKIVAGLVFAVVLSGSPGGLAHAASADLDETIRKVRMGTLVIEAAPGVEVRVEQLRHEFWFGAALASEAFGGWMNAADELARADRWPGPVRGPRLFRPAPGHRRRPRGGGQSDQRRADADGFSQAAIALARMSCNSESLAVEYRRVLNRNP